MLTLLALAGALLAWPDGPAYDRLCAVTGGAAGGRGAWRGLADRVPPAVAAPVLAGVVALVAAGPLQGCAAVLLAATVADLRGRARAHRDRLRAIAAWERALDDASSALRAGAGPDLAMDRAAAAAGGGGGRPGGGAEAGGAAGGAGVAAVLRAACAHARLGGDVSASLRGAGDPVAADLAGAWLLASRHGVPLVAAVDGLRADVAARRERSVRADATLAGPRATAVILTALPGFGVLMGSGFGADPVGVLVSGALGGVLCLVGAGFLAAGLMWTDRIVDGART